MDRGKNENYVHSVGIVVYSLFCSSWLLITGTTREFNRIEFFSTF